MKKVLLSIGLATTFLLTGCTYTNGYSSDSKITDVNKAISVAEAKYRVVHEEGIAWQKTKAKITKAKELVKQGKDKEALAFANEAIYEADQASIQSKEADKTWRNAVPQ